MAFGVGKVKDEPKIHLSLNQPDLPKANRNTNNKTKGKKATKIVNKEERGDLLVKEFWDSSTAAVFDVRVTDLDGATNQTKTTETILKQHEQEKKNKYLQACIKERRHFTPFVVSTDGMLGEEAKRVLQRIAGTLAKKWNKPYSQMVNFVRTRISIGIARATHLCIRGSRIPIKLICPRNPHWEDSTGFVIW
jgi:hypothetical protein